MLHLFPSPTHSPSIIERRDLFQSSKRPRTYQFNVCLPLTGRLHRRVRSLQVLSGSARRPTITGLSFTSRGLTGCPQPDLEAWLAPGNRRGRPSDWRTQAIEAKRQLEELVKSGKVQVSRSESAAPTLFILKKDGTKRGKRGHCWFLIFIFWCSSQLSSMHAHHGMSAS